VEDRAFFTDTKLDWKTMKWMTSQLAKSSLPQSKPRWKAHSSATWRLVE
jgi:hypothetical protein